MSSFGIKLHEYLYGDWDYVKDQLVQELDYLHNSLRLHWDSVFDENNNLTLEAIFGADPTPTRYIANTGPGGLPQWDRVNLANGVVGVLAYTHFPDLDASQLIGRRSSSGGDPEAIDVGDGLIMDGTTLKVNTLSGFTGGTPYFIPVDTTHTIPLYIQELFSMTIDVEGILDVEGFLIEVD